jgi:hypothetical protein
VVLSGTLREFILADVMQLLTQQKVTGKLILNNGRIEGYIMFREGTVVNAARDKETFLSKLFHYLTTVQQQPKNKVRELFSTYEGKVADLTAYLEQREILSQQELESYAISVIEDIACSLFLWSSGNYRFDSMRAVDSLIPANASIAVENIVMEAMRRIDEWHRMREIITEESIFVQTGNEMKQAEYKSPLDDPSSFFYPLIDGTSSVKVISQDAFVSEYKIYESLYFLLQEDLIRPLSESVTQSIRAAILKKEQQNAMASAMQPLLSLIISTGCILVIILFSWLYRGVIFSKLHISSTIRKSKINFIVAEEHYQDALRFYQTESINSLPKNGELDCYPLITKKDKFFLSLKRGFDKSTSEQYNE